MNFVPRIFYPGRWTVQLPHHPYIELERQHGHSRQTVQLREPLLGRLDDNECKMVTICIQYILEQSQLFWTRVISSKHFSSRADNQSHVNSLQYTIQREIDNISVSAARSISLNLNRFTCSRDIGKRLLCPLCNFIYAFSLPMKNLIIVSDTISCESYLEIYAMWIDCRVVITTLPQCFQP